jgi:hypothetical protein
MTLDVTVVIWIIIISFGDTVFKRDLIRHPASASKISHWISASTVIGLGGVIN